MAHNKSHHAARHSASRDGHYMEHPAHSKHHGHKEAHRHHAKMKHEHMLKQHEHGRSQIHPSGPDYKDSESINDNHQAGIERVIQREGEKEVGHHGDMHWSNAHREAFHKKGRDIY